MNHTHSTNSFTRGSQIIMHAIRMLWQGIKITLIISFSITGLWFLKQCFSKLKWYDFYYWFFERWATLKLGIGSTFFPTEEITITLYNFDDKLTKTFSAIQYKGMVWQSENGYRLINFKQWLYNDFLLEALIVFGFSVVIVYFLFAFRGKKSMEKSKIRGGDIITPKELTKQITKKNLDSNIIIEKLPLIKGGERQHILITGTTGTGKTNLFHEIIPQIRERGEKAIIFDLNGSFVGPYLKKSDHLLNPFDRRSVEWTPWADCTYSYDYDSLAEALVGETSLHDPFWDKSAIKIISEALQQFKNKQSLKDLIEILNIAPLNTYSSFFANTSVAAITNKEADKTITSIRANINDKIRSLMLLKDSKKAFSLRDYIIDKDNKWLFITSMPNQRNTLKSLISAWLEIVLCGLMQKNPAEENKNIMTINMH